MFQPFAVYSDFEKRDDERAVVENHRVAILVVEIVGQHLDGWRVGFAFVNGSHDARRIDLLAGGRTSRLRCDHIYGARESSIRSVNCYCWVIESPACAPGNSNRGQPIL